MKKTSNELPVTAGGDHLPTCVPEVEAIKTRGEYKVRLTTLSIAVILVAGGVIFSLLYPTRLTTIWSVITPIILTILTLAFRNNDRGKSVSR